MKHIIIAPHADDEIIGCYEILKKEKNLVVLYGTTKALEEAKKFCKINKILSFTIDDIILFSDEDIYYFPDPYFESHPFHRELGMMGEKMARVGFNVIFYSTNMQAPYIYEVKEPTRKRVLLEEAYPFKSSLWKYDHKYFLFEGYTKWIYHE